MKIACLSFTDKGKELGDKIRGLKDEEYIIHHYTNKEVEGGIKKIIPYLWEKYDGLVFMASTGIAIRMIAPYIKHKTIDPAVVVIDDLGRFSISLLSGHIGGANKLAAWIGERINATPVITTASDNRDIESIDLFAKKNNYYIEDMKEITKIAAMMVNEKNIGFYSEDNKIIDYPNLIILDDLQFFNLSQGVISSEIKNLNGLIIISSKTYNMSNIDIPYVYLRPKNINIGIGCRKGIERKRIIDAIETAFMEANLSIKSIKAIGTVEVKKDERGIIEAAKYFNCPIRIFTIDEIKEIENKFEKSQFVKDTIGVYSVSEPTAYLLGGKIIRNKLKFNGITISISKEMNNG
ncbi:MAG: cobalt-precorrin 5A hydrolase [Tissierellia bacterium]|nr:cobalt-precorrin 5A hydrolase [Tissierellia bacterium]